MTMDSLMETVFGFDDESKMTPAEIEEKRYGQGPSHPPPRSKSHNPTTLMTRLMHSHR